VEPQAELPPPKASPLKLACLACLGLLLVGCLVCVASGWGLSSANRKSTPYKLGFAFVTQNAEVQAALGEPIEATFLTSGNVIETLDGEGFAILIAPIRGPKGRGVATIRATRTQGQWTVDEVSVSLGQGDQNRLIKLPLGASATPTPASPAGR